MNSDIAKVLIFLIVFGFLGLIIYLNYKENIIAMENGYTQKVVNNKKIWVKTDCKSK